MKKDKQIVVRLRDELKPAIKAIAMESVDLVRASIRLLNACSMLAKRQAEHIKARTDQLE